MWTIGLELELEPRYRLAGAGPKWNGSTTLGNTITFLVQDFHVLLTVISVGKLYPYVGNTVDTVILGTTGYPVVQISSRSDIQQNPTVKMNENRHTFYINNEDFVENDFKILGLLLKEKKQKFRPNFQVIVCFGSSINVRSLLP